MNIFKHQFSFIRLCSLLFVFIIGVFGVAPVYAGNVTDNFELDGNVTTGTKDDWSTVNFSGGAANILAKTGVADDPAPQSIFTGGGSKDGLDLNGPLSGAGGWKYKDGSVPDKDNITNAYAAAYNVNGDLVIYAGADRFDNSGDAFMGFWFFQGQVGLGSGGAFSGQHVVGDTLVLANFSGGGTTVNIEVLQWVGTGGNVGGTLQRIAGIAGGAPAKCGAAGTPANFCGITNAVAGETPPWAYTNKDGTHAFQTAGFLELGINITQVFKAANPNSATPCFSAFMAETRSSTSVTATLKDFVLHSFPVCSIAVSKACGSGVLNASVTPPLINYPITGRVQNNGFGQLTNVTLVDDPAVSVPFTYHQCLANSDLPDLTTTASLSPLNGGVSVCYKGTVSSVTNGASDTVTASGSAGSSPLTAKAGATCQPIPVSPAISVTKDCTVALDSVSSLLALKINVSGKVCNTGDLPLANVSITDTDGVQPLISLTGVPTTLAVAACADYTGSYYPLSADNRLGSGSTTVPGLASFSDKVTVNATAAFGTVTPAFTTATCKLCPTCTPDTCEEGTCRTSGFFEQRTGAAGCP